MSEASYGPECAHCENSAEALCCACNTPYCAADAVIHQHPESPCGKVKAESKGQLVQFDDYRLGGSSE